MELFTITKVSSKLGLPLKAIKYGSDLTNSDVQLGWKKSMNQAKFLYYEKIKKTFSY